MKKRRNIFTVKIIACTMVFTKKGDYKWKIILEDYKKLSYL